MSDTSVHNMQSLNFYGTGIEGNNSSYGYDCEMRQSDYLSSISDISLSQMTNYSQTCWFNSVCKYMVTFFGKNNDIIKVINNAIVKCDNSTKEGKYAKLVLQSLAILFTDLSNNKL
jgi:hypothetical protein